MLDCAYFDFDDGGTHIYGPKEFVCRTQRPCMACKNDMQVGQRIFKFPIRDHSSNKLLAPVWVCWNCGLMFMDFEDRGFGSFDLFEDPKEQWLEHIAELEE